MLDPTHRLVPHPRTLRSLRLSDQRTGEEKAAVSTTKYTLLITAIVDEAINVQVGGVSRDQAIRCTVDEAAHRKVNLGGLELGYSGPLPRGKTQR